MEDSDQRALAARIEDLASKIAAKACIHCYGSYDKQDSRYHDAFSFAQVDVLLQLRKEPERFDRRVIKYGRKRTVSHLSYNAQAVKISRKERKKRQAQGLPIDLLKAAPNLPNKSSWEYSGPRDWKEFDPAYHIAASKPAPDIYSRCRDDKDIEIVDWYTTRKRDAKESRSQKECAKAVGLSEDKTIERLNWLRDDNEPKRAPGWEPRHHHKADPAILRKPGRDEFEQDRNRWYCCEDAFDLEVFDHYVGGMSPRQIADKTDTTVRIIEDRLRRLAHRALLK